MGKAAVSRCPFRPSGFAASQASVRKSSHHIPAWNSNSPLTFVVFHTGLFAELEYSL